MKDINLEYQRWIDHAEDLPWNELIALGDDPKALEDAFYRDLSFGTGGLRGIVGVGPNRMNVCTVAKATQGLADYLSAHFEDPSVAIARDSRRMGEEFACAAAEVLAANGVRALLYPRIEPTPMLSFAVRELGCSAGVCVTASHNPAEYNGYKVYGPDGCQVTMQAAADIQHAIDAVDVFDDVRRMPFDQAKAEGLVGWIDDEVIDAYVAAVLAQSRNIDCGGLKVAYTPLHGAGLEPMVRVLEGIGVGDVAVEPEQAVPDGAFPTCLKPNPEERAALELGLRLVEREGSDVLIASDPDADRLGVAVRHGEGFVLLNGNEVSMLLLDFLLQMGCEMGLGDSRPVVLTTVVSAPMADSIALDRGFELRRTLTGFKYLGEQVGLLERTGEVNRFLFAFEESYGYLAGAYVRDKDAMVAAILVCQAVAWHRSHGRDLLEAMDTLYQRYGYYFTALLSVGYLGAEGADRMKTIMHKLREQPPVQIAGRAVERVVDYLPGIAMPVVNGARSNDDINKTTSDNIQMLPSADVFEMQLTGGAKVVVRPSGTEPKIKAYVSVCEDTRDTARQELDILSAAVKDLLK